jgi:hypothetical protein
MRGTADASILFISQRNASGEAIGTGVRVCDGPSPRHGALLMRRPEPGANAAPCATSSHAHTWCPRIVLALSTSVQLQTGNAFFCSRRFVDTASRTVQKTLEFCTSFTAFRPQFVTMGTDNGDKKQNVEGKFQQNGMPDMSGEKSGGFASVCARASGATRKRRRQK